MSATVTAIHPTLNCITTTVRDLHAALEAVDAAQGLHPMSEIQFMKTDEPDSPLSVSWGEEIADSAVIREGRALRHDDKEGDEMVVKLTPEQAHSAWHFGLNPIRSLIADSLQGDWDSASPDVTNFEEAVNCLILLVPASQALVKGELPADDATVALFDRCERYWREAIAADIGEPASQEEETERRTRAEDVAYDRRALEHVSAIRSLLREAQEARERERLRLAAAYLLERAARADIDLPAARRLYSELAGIMRQEGVV